ncbi:hypothetical protein [Bacteroides mediterraneensis]|uniref:Lipocalin-like domain-containing protein n=1 Tax=Bacteroides mediterraneensis TaxID=1841856 RepID=A0ABS2EXQ3_9BACE|nr:hypothetical protein [Bacteroides mediterraneensis]MBM6759098.1 hypothetical protein [Bacteroides mediterraneensis]
MKKLKNVWLFLSLVLMVAGLASCSTEDPTGVEVSREDIIGTWKVTANDWSDSEGDSGRNDHVGMTLTLNSDGTTAFQGYHYQWTLGNQGVLTVSGAGNLNVRVTILSLENGVLQATYSYGSSSEAYEVEGNYTFQRM